MKRIILLFGFLLSFVAVKSQSTDPQTVAHTRAVRMQQMLNLNNDQTTQVEQVWLEFLQNTVRIQGDNSLAPAEIQRRLEQEKAERDRKFSQILTQLQYNQMLKLRNEAQQGSQQNK